MLFLIETTLTYNTRLICAIVNNVCLKNLLDFSDDTRVPAVLGMSARDA